MSNLQEYSDRPVWALDWTDQPVTIDPMSMHTVVSGATRSGKSVGAYAMLSQISRIPYVTIVGIDPNVVTLQPHSVNRPGDFALGSSPDSLAHSLEILHWLEAEMERRVSKLVELRTDKLTTEHVSRETPAVLLVLEEFAGYQAALEGLPKEKGQPDPKKEAIRVIGRLLREGAKTLIHVFTIIQRPEAATLPERAQYSRRISFRLDNADSVRMLFEEATDECRAAVLNFSPGRALLHEAGEAMHPVTVPYLEYSDYLDRVNIHHHPLIPTGGDDHEE